MGTPHGWTRRALMTAGIAGIGGIIGCSAEIVTGEGQLHTAHWPGGRPRWRMAIPPEPTGLVIALHGYGGNADSAFEGGLELQTHVAGTGLAVVSVDGAKAYWHRRRDGSDTGAMVLDELLSLALARAGLPRTTRPAFLGYSMGGFGAMWLARTIGPDRVRAIVAESPAVWLRGADTPAGAFDDAADFDAHTPFGYSKDLAALRLRIDCGTADPFYAATKELAKRLPHAEITFDSGDHSMGYWRSHAQAQMRWIADQPA